MGQRVVSVAKGALAARFLYSRLGGGVCELSACFRSAGHSSIAEILKKRNISGAQRSEPPAQHRLPAAAPVAACLLLHKVHHSPLCTSSLPMESGSCRPRPRYSREMGQVARAGYPTFHPVLGWGSACLSLNSSYPSGVFIAFQTRVGATTQSHHTQEGRVLHYSQKDQSWKACARKERGTWRRGPLSLQPLTLIPRLPGEAVRR